jgi:putative ATP-dependent endonuclease of OLD family
MFIQKVVIENFKRFKGKHTFEFTNGLNILVGDNEIGKSTVLEAVHLALTGYYHGNRIERELSQYLFNKEATDEWLKNKNTPLPEIFIEVFLDGCEDKMLKSDFNSDKDGNAFGVRFSVVFNDEYKEEYEKISGQEISGLPVEYYKIQWETFAREHITTRSVPIKSSLIDTSEYRYGNASDAYVSGIVKNYLEDSKRPQIAQAYRELKEKFGENEVVKSINDRLQGKTASTEAVISVFGFSPAVAVDMGTANAWEKSLIVELENIPLPYRGKGCQKMVKTELALSKKQSENADIILLEEPENHLSFSKLNQLVKYISDKCSGKQIIISTHSSFVANKLGLDKLILLSEDGCMRMTDLKKDTAKYFKKLPGYDTLRLILCEKAVLVEGPSDELIVQRAYKDKYGEIADRRRHRCHIGRGIEF